ncbi:hypothetical protein Pint_00202 [Pistacia integerrima]|uniref:Uncharacterized protein n=1 Tax=Pistacia integerrima TaxID=434235 RepID=A0ACC0ZKN8_9ROSI|nr:hypothetical protein Pint_00202 [Pistacia integerrima]
MRDSSYDFQCRGAQAFKPGGLIPIGGWVLFGELDICFPENLVYLVNKYAQSLQEIGHLARQLQNGKMFTSNVNMTLAPALVHPDVHVPCPPKISPSPPSVPMKPEKCPKDKLKFGVCGSWLGLVYEVVGTKPSKQCCNLIEGLADLEAALCLCTAIKANALGAIKLEVPIALSSVLNSCDKKVPQGFQC